MTTSTMYEVSSSVPRALRLVGAVCVVVAGLIFGAFTAPPKASAQQQTIACPSNGWFGTSASEYMRGDPDNIPSEESLVGLGGDDRIDAFFLKDCVLGNAGEDVVFGGKGTDVVYGYEDSDWIYGGADYDELFGGDGNDFIYGGAVATNHIDGGAGYDVCYLQGNDTIANTTNCEQWPQAIPRANMGTPPANPPAPFPCQSGGQAMLASDDEDVSYGDIGGPAHNTFFGAIGADTARGGEWSDCLYGGPGPDWLSGGQHRDHMIGDTGSDELYGGDGDDYISGEGSDQGADESDSVDTIDGGAGNDRLIGGRGTDEIYGGPGDDFCRGGPDNGNTDKFVGCEIIKND